MAYFMVASSACVIFPSGLNSEPYRKITVEPHHAPDRSDYENSLQELKLSMFIEELKALKISYEEMNRLNLGNARKGGFVMLDGPIIDPPIFRPGNTELKEKYKQYVRERIRLVSKLLGLGCYAVGIIKRIRGNHLVSLIRRIFANSTKNDDIISDYLNDFTFVNLLFQKLAYNTLLDTNLGTTENTYGTALATKPIELSNTRSDYPVYLDLMREYCEYSELRNVFKIFHFYVMPNIGDPKSRVLGIEIAVPVSCSELWDEEHPKETYVLKLAQDISRFLSVWTLPGQPYPLPVILAHNSCTIKRRTAKKVLKDLISRFIRDTLILNNSFNRFSYIAQNIDTIIE